MPTMTYHIDRNGDEDTEIELEYEMSPFIHARTYGLTGDCYPAECGEIGSLNAYLDGVMIELTPEETKGVRRADLRPA